MENRLHDHSSNMMMMKYSSFLFSRDLKKNSELAGLRARRWLPSRLSLVVGRCKWSWIASHLTIEKKAFQHSRRPKNLLLCERFIDIYSVIQLHCPLLHLRIGLLGDLVQSRGAEKADDSIMPPNGKTTDTASTIISDCELHSLLGFL
jgi:hypothetical protein